MWLLVVDAVVADAIIVVVFAVDAVVADTIIVVVFAAFVMGIYFVQLSSLLWYFYLHVLFVSVILSFSFLFVVTFVVDRANKVARFVVVVVCILLFVCCCFAPAVALPWHGHVCNQSL